MAADDFTAFIHRLADPQARALAGGLRFQPPRREADRTGSAPTLTHNRLRRCEGCAYMRPETELAAYLIAGRWVFLYCGPCDAARATHPSEKRLGAPA